MNLHEFAMIVSLPACAGLGGAIAINGSVSSSGKMVFKGCRSSDSGLVHMIEPSLNLSAAPADFASPQVGPP